MLTGCPMPSRTPVPEFDPEPEAPEVGCEPPPLPTVVVLVDPQAVTRMPVNVSGSRPANRIDGRTFMTFPP
jgi:hypothetical protein